jgi:hypothetical protein
MEVPTTKNENKESFYSAMVWIISGVGLITYGTMGVLSATIPGVEELVAYLSTASGTHIYIAAFVSILIEGTYLVGNFFPGTTLIVILTILSQVSGVSVFIGTILCVLLGWYTAGAINIYLAKTYYKKMISPVGSESSLVHDRLFTTWFPAFRANYEVAQITEGGSARGVFFSSLRVKTLVVGVATIGALLVPYVLDIHSISNEEGFLTIAAVATISIAVGSFKLFMIYRHA